ncbi:MAG: lipocalin-like domain-containing protein [Methylocella sp.]
MNRLSIFSLSAIVGLGLASTAMLGMLSGVAHAQSAKDLVGTWRLVSTTNTNAQGVKTEPFGPHPMGSYTFDASGHFTQAIVPGEKGSATGIVAAFGDYSVTNGGKTLVRHILGSQDLGAVAKNLPLEITLANDELTTSNSNPTVNSIAHADIAHADSVWRRVQ